MKVINRHGTAAELHALEMPTGGDAELWIMKPSEVALVKGSAQKPEAFDRAALAAAGVELAARRSGGGAVWIDPGQMLWIDVLAPRASPLWSDDLAATFAVVGQAWQRAFASLGVELDLVTSDPSRDPLSRWVCWAGQGWGELVRADQPGISKVLGLSQRRTRWGARVQAMAVFDASALRAADWFTGEDAPSPTALRERLGNPGLGEPIDQQALQAAVIAELQALR